MNIKDGNIIDRSKGRPYTIPQELWDMMEPVDMSELTAKQAETKRVSLHDTRSTLGKRLSARRNNPCICGSGVKFKKCCGKRNR